MCSTHTHAVSDFGIAGMAVRVEDIKTLIIRCQYHNCIPGVTYLVPGMRYRALHQSLANTNNTRGASPRRDDARLGSANVRNYRGCRQIEAVNATVLPRGTIKNESRLNEERKRWDQIR